MFARRINNYNSIVLATFLLMAVLMPRSVSADSTHGGHLDSHNLQPNVIALFVGVTSEDRREGAFTLGLEYERHLSTNFGIGVIVEHAFGDLDF